MPKFVFFGTAEYAVQVLDTLKQGDLVPRLVVTTPDAPQGRQLRLMPPPVKVWAEQNGIRVIQPVKLLPTISELQATHSDFFVVAAYGKIMPSKVLAIPKYATLCVHPSLLPRSRGPSPVQSTILSGDTIAGVTILEVDKEVDHGPIVLQKAFALRGTETSADLNDLLWKEGGKMVAEIIKDPALLEAKKTQEHSKATFSQKIEKSAAEIPADIILGKAKPYPIEPWERKVRAYFPNPLAYTVLKIKSGKELRVQILKAHTCDEMLIPDIVKPEGKKEMSWEDFKRGNL